MNSEQNREGRAGWGRKREEAGREGEGRGGEEGRGERGRGESFREKEDVEVRRRESEWFAELQHSGTYSDSPRPCQCINKVFKSDLILLPWQNLRGFTP